MSRRFMLLPPVLIFALGTLAGCPSRDVSAVDPSQAKEQQKEIPVNINRQIDILWVIDNSNSMAQEQASLAANFPVFVEVLETIEGGLPDIHMGIVSSDMGTPGHALGGCQADNGDDGVLQIEPPGQDCGDLTGGRYIEDILADDGVTRLRNYPGDLADQFSCMAQLGTSGCGFEQHLASMQAALENTDENAGFLRPEAFLAVIFIQDEDDCSAYNSDLFGGSVSDTIDSELGEYSSYRCFEYGTDCDPDAERTVGPRDNCVPAEDSPYIESVSTYIDFLKGVKDDPSKVIVAAITGPPSPVSVIEDGDPAKDDQLWLQPACLLCQGGGSDCDAQFRSDGDAIVAAAPAIRMNALLDAFPARSTFQSICTPNEDGTDVDLSGALTQIAELLKVVVGSPCIDGMLVDSDPATGGLQPECHVSDVRDLNLPTEEEFPIPSCDVSPDPTCFTFIEDNQNCSTTDTHLALFIDRGDPPMEPPLNTTVVARCLVQ